MISNFLLEVSFSKTSFRSAARSRDPSALITDRPRASEISSKTVCFCNRDCTDSSQSKKAEVGIRRLIIFPAVDFPVAIPPVRANTCMWKQSPETLQDTSPGSQKQKSGTCITDPALKKLFRTNLREGLEGQCLQHLHQREAQSLYHRHSHAYQLHQ